MTFDLVLLISNELKAAIPMPSIKVNGPTVSPNQFDIIGTGSEDTGFIQHTGLASTGGSQNAGAVRVCEMGPPLRNTGQMAAHALGTANLTDDEVRKIKSFIDRYQGEHLEMQHIRLTPKQIPAMYCIAPHAVALQDRNGRYVRMRFSCAGFVYEAYKSAGIKIVNEQHFPAAPLAMIQQAYPTFAGLLTNQALRESLGLEGAGPWPVLLCGYLFHALNRNPQQIRQTPHITQSGEECFN